MSTKAWNTQWWTLCYLTNAGLMLLAKHWKNWARPLVVPSASGLGDAFLSRIKLNLMDPRFRTRTTKEILPKTYEKARTAIRLIANVTTIPTQSAPLTHPTVTFPSESTPKRAKRFSNGRPTNAHGNSRMQMVYMKLGSNVRRSQGIRKSCRTAEVNPEIASEYPISSVGRESPPDAIGEKQKSTNTTSNPDDKKESAEPDKHRALTTGLAINDRRPIDDGLELACENSPAAFDSPFFPEYFQSTLDLARLSG